MIDTDSSGRDFAIQLASDKVASGNLYARLEQRIARKTVSQDADCATALRRYLSDDIAPTLEGMGFSCRIIENPRSGHPPLLIGHRIEAPELPTLLTYGHGDVTSGQDELWSGDLSPWSTTFEKGRIYGRGSADNKGQHSINLAALESVIEARQGTLGYNIKVLFEMSEEIGSPGLEEVCEAYREELASDLFLASDGPRIRHDMPTLFLGSRGVVQFRLIADPGNGARHSGNWGGIITNPAAELANAVATLISPTGKILADSLRAPEIPDDVARLIRDLPVGGSDGDPEVNPGWGEAGLTDGERLYGTNTLEIVGLSAGRTDKPVGAIPERAEAILQLRFVKGTDWQAVERNLREHLDARGLAHIEVQHAGGYAATRLDPAHPWVEFVTRSAADSLGEAPAVLPNLGGTIPNHCFSDVLGLPTVWLPHSYPSCNQHAPDEHLLEHIVEEGVKLAAGIFWDLGSSSGGRLAERADSAREAPLDA